jgi:hypothetical protein
MKRFFQGAIGAAILSLTVISTGFAAGTNQSTNASTNTSVKVTVTKWPFYVYKDGFDRANHFVASGWMGDFGAIKYTDKWISNPKSGKSCIRIDYTGKRTQGAGWGGIYWQEPALNWGNLDGGFDLTGAQSVYFWARGEQGGEQMEFKIGGIKGKNRDSAEVSTGTLSLTKEWKLYTMNLSYYEMDNVIGGFCVVFTAQGNPQGMIFYIDEVCYDTNSVETVKATVK